MTLQLFSHFSPMTEKVAFREHERKISCYGVKGPQVITLSKISLSEKSKPDET